MSNNAHDAAQNASQRVIRRTDVDRARRRMLADAAAGRYPYAPPLWPEGGERDPRQLPLP